MSVMSLETLAVKILGLPCSTTMVSISCTAKDFCPPFLASYLMSVKVMSMKNTKPSSMTF